MAQRLGCACQVARLQLTASPFDADWVLPGEEEEEEEEKSRSLPATVSGTAGKLGLGIRYVKVISQITSRGRTRQPSVGSPGCMYGPRKRDSLRWQAAKKPLAKYTSALLSFLLFFFFFFGWVRRLESSSGVSAFPSHRPPTPPRCDMAKENGEFGDGSWKKHVDDIKKTFDFKEVLGTWVTA